MAYIMESLKRPFSDLRRSGLLFLLLIPPLSFFSFPWVYGYIFATMGHVIRLKKSLPPWEGFWILLKDGLLLLLVSFVLALPGYALLVMSMPGVVAIADPAVSALTRVLAYILLFFCSICLPSVLLSAARNMDWSAVFDLRGMISQILNLDYIIAWMVSLALAVSLAVLSFGVIGLCGSSWLGIAISSIFVGFTSAFSSLFASSLFARCVARMPSAPGR